MTLIDERKLRVIEQVIAKKITAKEAAELLDLSERQIYRLKRGVLEQGPEFAMNKRAGIKPVHALSDELKAKIVKLKNSEKYKNSSCRAFRDLLEKDENISLSYSTVHRVLREKSQTNTPKKQPTLTLGHKNGWIDVSVEITESMPIYPGDPAFVAKPVKILGKNSRVNLTEITLGTHTGTHVDAPSHVLPEGKTLTHLELEPFVGICYVLEVAEFTADVLERLPRSCKRVLIKANSNLPGKPHWLTDYRGLPTDFARLLLEHLKDKPLLVGIDALSVEERGKKVLETHKLLLEREIVVLEGLDLSKVQEGHYELVALPLKLSSLDGSPVRAVLKTIL